MLASCHRSKIRPCVALSTEALSFAQGQRGDLLLAPAVPGEIIMIHCDGQREWALQKTAYMASDESVEVKVKTQGLAQGCCSGEGFFVLRATGRGRLLINSFGGIMRYDLQPGEVRARVGTLRLLLMAPMLRLRGVRLCACKLPWRCRCPCSFV
jgi:uncharacterized protein (AIM24 family)